MQVHDTRATVTADTVTAVENDDRRHRQPSVSAINVGPFFTASVLDYHLTAYRAPWFTCTSSAAMVCDD